VTGLAVDPKTDDVITVGSFKGMIDFGAGVTLSASAPSEAFYVRLDSTLRGIHAHRFPSSERVDVRGVVVSGTTSDAVLFGSFAGDLAGTTSNGRTDGFIVTVDGTGTVGEVAAVGEAGDGTTTIAAAAAVPNQDAVVFVGTTYGVHAAPKHPYLASNGLADMFLLRRSFSGSTTIDAMTFGDDGNELPQAIAVDGAGNVIVTGEVRGTRVTLGGGRIAPLGGDVFIAKYDAKDLEHRWSKVFAHPSEQIGSAIAVDALGNIVVAGSFEEAIHFGGPTPLLTASGGPGYWDAFVATFMP
jgi:hypothetical protein